MSGDAGLAGPTGTTPVGPSARCLTCPGCGPFPVVDGVSGLPDIQRRKRFWFHRFADRGVTVSIDTDLVDFFPSYWVKGVWGTVYVDPIPCRPFRCCPGGFCLEGLVMGLISQALGNAAASAKGVAASDPTFEKAYPTLHAFMTSLEEDGKTRSPSSLTVFTEDGQWKGVLTEKDADLKLWRSGDTLNKLYAAMEKALASGSADWRRASPGGNQARGRARGK